jgi:drug/metabolite transporter (DMT)-like permease
MALKYFPLVYVSLIYNLAPLLVVLFSYILYKEGLSRLDIAILFASFFGVILLITGSFSESDKQKEGIPISELIIPAILMLSIPVN